MLASDVQNNALIAEKKRREAAAKAAQSKLQSDWQNVQNGGYNVTRGTVDRTGDFNLGMKQGNDIFVNDPRMQELLKTREDLAKGYDSSELGAMRGIARGEVAGQRSNYLRSLSSNLARGGVGGARAAAVRGAADQKYAEQGAEQERKMLLDSAQMKRTGQNDLQDFIFKQKYGLAGLGLAQQAQGVAERTNQAANAANSGGSGSWLCTEVHKHSKFTLSEMKTLKKLKLYALEKTPNALRYFNECEELVHAMNSVEFKWTNLKAQIQDVIEKFKDCPSCALSRYEMMTFTLIDLYKPELRNGTN